MAYDRGANRYANTQRQLVLDGHIHRRRAFYGDGQVCERL